MPVAWRRAAAGLVTGLRVEGWDVVVVEVPEPHQASAALRVPDQRGELLIGGTSRQRGEQRPDVRLADAVVDAVQDNLERPFAGEHMAAHGDVEDVFGCHRFLLCEVAVSEPLLAPSRAGAQKSGAGSDA